MNLRNFAYHYCVRHLGTESAVSEYTSKFFSYLLFYYMTFLVLLVQIYVYISGPGKPIKLSFVINIILGVIFILIPMRYLVTFLLKWVGDTPIPDELSDNEYSRLRAFTLITIFTGLVLLIISAILPIYFMGGKIQIGNYIIQRGS